MNTPEKKQPTKHTPELEMTVVALRSSQPKRVTVLLSDNQILAIECLHTRQARYLYEMLSSIMIKEEE